MTTVNVPPDAAWFAATMFLRCFSADELLNWEEDGGHSALQLATDVCGLNPERTAKAAAWVLEYQARHCESYDRQRADEFRKLARTWESRAGAKAA